MPTYQSKATITEPIPAATITEPIPAACITTDLPVVSPHSAMMIVTITETGEAP